MNGPQLFQNTLLVIIAALLLVIVIQNSQSHSGWEGASVNISTSDGYAPSTEKPAPMKPPMKGSMVFQALRGFPKGCDGAKILADCNSPEAESVKEEILKMEESGKGPRQIFDAVVAKWGEKVLTDQALQIRRMRVKGPGK